MRVAIVGNRDYPNLEQVRAYVRSLPTGTVVVSGDGIGVDRAAVDEAHRIGGSAKVWPPEYDKYSKRVAPIMRNQQIVDDCDRLVAFQWPWTARGQGTEDAIRRARKAGKPVQIITTEDAS